MWPVSRTSDSVVVSIVPYDPEGIHIVNSIIWVIIVEQIPALPTQTLDLPRARVLLIFFHGRPESPSLRMIEVLYNLHPGVNACASLWPSTGSVVGCASTNNVAPARGAASRIGMAEAAQTAHVGIMVAPSRSESTAVVHRIDDAR